MKIYKGIRLNPEQGTASDVEVTVEEKSLSLIISSKPLTHHICHSPTGFNWGYGGSGPADLARSILWDYLGEEPTPELYQEFKNTFVTGWKERWQITSTEIKIWIIGKYGKDYFHYLTKTDQSDPRD